MHVRSVIAVLALVLGAVGLAVPVALPVPGPGPVEGDGDVSDQGAEVERVHSAAKVNITRIGDGY